MDQYIRINKYLQAAGICSRRGADELIRDGRVTVNGQPAALGDQICAEAGDIVCVDGSPVHAGEQERILLAVHKPVGIVCTEDPRERDNIIDFLHYPQRITYAGRLDKRTSGLLLMTNDGDLIERMMRGRNAHEKEYVVTVDRDLQGRDLELMGRGVPIEVEEKEIVTRPCRIHRTGLRSFRIVLTQGLNRQIRRMCAHCGYEVVSLKRVRIMNILLGDLQPGAWRHVTEAELSQLEDMLGNH